MRRMILLIIGLAAVLLQHVIHEMSHVVSARLLGEQIDRIQWFTYQGGTRVFFKNEPDFKTTQDKKWVWIAASGYLVTNFIGYLLLTLYCMTDSRMVKCAVCIPAILFLLMDCIYFVFGSIGNFGDIIGIRTILHIPSGVSIAEAVSVLIINFLLVLRVFY